MMKVVIISRKRARIIANATFRIFKSATVSIAEEEVDDYARAGVPRKQMLIHPNDVVGLCKKRNWVLKNVPDEVVVMLDDDCKCIASMVGHTYRKIDDEATIMALLKNSEQAAREVGTGLFCFNRAFDMKKYNPDEPFGFVGYPAALVGLIGREIWYDENNMLHDDVDIGLQAIQKWRVIWVDKRFAYVQSTQTTRMLGGCQTFITAQRDRREREYLKAKWGKYYQIEKWHYAGVKSFLNVKRRQTTILTPEKL